MPRRKCELQVVNSPTQITLPVSAEVPMLTFGQAFATYCEVHAKRHLKSYEEILGLYRRYLTCLEDKKLNEIRRIGVQCLHDAIGKNAGKPAANKAIELISVVYNKMITWQLYEGVNPGTLIKKFPTKQRSRFLQRNEMKPFLEAVKSCKSVHVADICMIALLTGARSGNVLSMRWDDIDLANSIWTIPETETKTGEEYKIPLIPEAVSILKRRKRKCRIPGNPYVFPSSTSKTGYMHNIRKSWYFILRRAGLSNFRFHDLRRSMGSWQVMTGASLPVIGKTLCHSSPQSTAIYARSDLKPVRTAMLMATTAMFMAGGKKIKKEKTDPYASIEF